MDIVRILTAPPNYLKDMNIKEIYAAFQDLFIQVYKDLEQDAYMLHYDDGAKTRVYSGFSFVQLEPELKRRQATAKICGARIKL